jgi:hypothetical protein
MIHIHWQLFVAASSADKAHKIIRSCADALAKDVTVVECDRYWKDHALFRVVIRSPIVAFEASAGVLETLQDCGRLAGRWVVGPPQMYAGDAWQFTGSAEESTICISGVRHIDFDVRNMERPVDQSAARGEPARI